MLYTARFLIKLLPCCTKYQNNFIYLQCKIPNNKRNFKKKTKKIIKMKQVITVSIGNKSFTIENEAYQLLKDYLEDFRTKSSLGIQSDDTMSDIEERIAEILSTKVGPIKNVVDVNMVDEITAQLGMPDGQPYTKRQQNSSASNNASGSSTASFAQGQQAGVASKKLYRDSDNKSIGGVCAGLGHYFGIDATIIKLIFVVLFIAGASGLLIYIIFWIIAPLAVTPLQKCEMRGWPATAENLAKFKFTYR